MKKKFMCILSVLLVLCFVITPAKPKAATVDSKATATSKAGMVTIGSGWINVRKEASTSSSILKTLGNGRYLTLISLSGDWWRVEYQKDEYGYCHKNYITVVSKDVKTVNASTLNIRENAGTGYSIIGTLKKGDIVIVISTSNGWSRVLHSGNKVGFVSSKYLSNTDTPSTNYKAISLNVPSFKQTDSRWANVKIGSSGKTISKIGCATTAIAMMESYRTGTTIYPDAMSKKLKYTSSGSVYWPSNYTSVTSSSNYLSKIYTQLQNGKPVLFGAKNSYGSQHWVVITSYKGGDVLSASNFTVNDPGSKTRVTLQQFLNAYPKFYKYFYY